LTGVNLSGIDLSNKDLTGTILKDAKKIEISLKNPSNSNWSALNEIQNLNVTRYDLSGDVQYLATKEGFLFESKNNKSRLVLDLNKMLNFPLLIVLQKLVYWVLLHKTNLFMFLTQVKILMGCL